MPKHLLQVFLSYRADTPGIFEVLIDQDSDELSCNCPGFRSKETCMHVEIVERRMEDNGGLYPFRFLRKVDSENLKAAMANEATFREFVIKNTKIEAI